MRFVFSPPADEAAGLLSLPWEQPLADWHDDRLVEIRQRGISRHVVRFVADSGVLYALKSISERLARREYRLLRSLAELNVPAVEVVGIVVDRGADADAILVTRYLEYSTTYRALFSNPSWRPAHRPAASTPWSSCWPGCTCPGSSGATARCPTRCSAPTPARWRPTWSTPRPASSTTS